MMDSNVFFLLKEYKQVNKNFRSSENEQRARMIEISFLMIPFFN